MTNAVSHMRAGGVSLVVDHSAFLPRIVHWGAGEWQIAESIRKLALELRQK